MLTSAEKSKSAEKVIKVVFFSKEFCLNTLTPLDTLSIIKKVKMEIFCKNVSEKIGPDGPIYFF